MCISILHVLSPRSQFQHDNFYYETRYKISIFIHFQIGPRVKNLLILEHGCADQMANGNSYVKEFLYTRNALSTNASGRPFQSRILGCFKR